MIGPTPLLDFFKRGEVERDVKMQAAQGTLAPRAHGSSRFWCCSSDPDREIRTTADETLNKIPVEALQAFLGRPTCRSTCAFFADRGIFPDEMPEIQFDADEPLLDAGEDDALLVGAEDEDRQTAMQKLQTMSFTDRMKAAVRGSREMRAILVRDSNKMIAAAVMSSPKMTEQEVEAIAGMASVSEDVLRIIANNRGWMKNYKCALRLVKNPKTPIAVSMNVLPRIMERDLVGLSTDRNVPEPLRVATRKR